MTGRYSLIPSKISMDTQKVSDGCGQSKTSGNCSERTLVLTQVLMDPMRTPALSLPIGKFESHHLFGSTRSEHTPGTVVTCAPTTDSVVTVASMTKDSSSFPLSKIPMVGGENTPKTLPSSTFPCSPLCPRPPNVPGGAPHSFVRNSCPVKACTVDILQNVERRSPEFGGVLAVGSSETGFLNKPPQNLPNSRPPRPSVSPGPPNVPGGTPHSSPRDSCPVKACTVDTSQSVEWWSPGFGAALDVGGSGVEALDGILDCYLGDSPSGATDRALNEVQSYGSLRTISPSITTMDSSPMNDTIEEIIASFDKDLGQLPLPDLSILFPGF